MPETKITKRLDYQVPSYLIDSIHLRFDLRDEYTIVTSHLQIKRNADSNDTSNTLVLNGEELILERIMLNGTILSASHYQLVEDLLLIHDVPEKFELEIKTKLFPEKNTALSGLYRSANAYCTQCEAEGFRRITYFPDRPDVLSRYTVTITADQKQYPYLLSNGNLISTGGMDEDRHYATWEDPFKKPCYLFALVAGDFDVIEDLFTTQSGRKVTLKIYVEKGLGDQAQHAMYSIKEAMKWDEKAYGREYDLDVYMIAAMSDFNMGAMENKGLNIFNTKYVLAKPETATDDNYIHILSVIAHEYFHNWTGNRVTCRDWFQLSLKEGLTIFRDQTFSEDSLSRAVMRIQDVNYLREFQFPEDAGPLAHPVRPESYMEINNFYTATVYNKGAEVLRMLQTMLGKELFRQGMDLYFKKYDGKAVTIDDFVDTMQEVSEIDLTQFRQWYNQVGTPIVNVEDDYDSNNKIYRLTISQNQHLQIPIRLGLLDTNGNEIAPETLLFLTNPSQQFEFTDIPSRPIPSLLRHFSAPVKINYTYNDSDLLTLLKHDKDAFNRWEAGQKYSLRLILNLINDYQQQKPLALSDEFINTFAYLLQDKTEDPWLIAEMLRLPSETYIGEQMPVIDVDAIHAVREFVLQTLAKKLEPLLLQVYQQHQSDNYHFSIQEVGKRQLKNRCLAFLMLLPSGIELGWKQFVNSLQNNMTDTAAALAEFASIASPYTQQVLEQFLQAWKADTLVMDKWFVVQAASKLPNTLQTVKNLMQHPTFDIKNPNKVYSLIGMFGRNQVRLHAANGEGYAFLREVVQTLDKLNPQVAARMVKPLTSWKRYDKERQQLMKAQLELLLQDKKLSPDVFELVNNSL